MKTDLADASQAPRKKKYWLAITLRFLCVAITLVSVIFACLASRIRHGERQRAVINGVQETGGTVWFADEQTNDGYSRTVFPPLERSLTQRVLGDGYVRTIHSIDLGDVDDVDGELLLRIARLPELRSLTVSAPVTQMPELREIERSNPDLELTVLWDIRHAPSITTIKSIKDFDNTLNDGRCVLFIDGDWAVPAAASRPVFAKFAHTWRAESNQSVHFIRLDFTESNTRLWDHVQEWMDSESVERGGYKSYGGVGKVIWTWNGRVLEHAWHVGDSTTEEMIERTLSVFLEAVSKPV